jgi:BlaI family penicillinase repressor
MTKREACGKLSPFQLEIMNIVWDCGELTVAELVRKLNQRRPVARSTAQTMLSRLEDRGWLTHRQDGAAFRYSAVHKRSDALENMVGRLVDTAFRGSAEHLVLALLKGRGISEAEAQGLHKMIDDMSKEES